MQRYFAIALEENCLLLEESDLHHIKNVMRNKVGDKIECIYQEKLYICEIRDLTSNRVNIIEELFDNSELQWDITIAVALVKEQKMDFILQKLTELGVSQIIPLKTERSIIKLEDNKVKKKQERWIKICKEAAEQSKRNKVPVVLEPISLSKLNDYSFSEKYICSTTSKNLLSNGLLSQVQEKSKMIFVIGPEGGISPKEEEYLESIGYKSISLGSRIMRVETATIYIASVLNFCSMG